MHFLTRATSATKRVILRVQRIKLMMPAQARQESEILGKLEILEERIEGHGKHGREHFGNGGIIE